MVFTQAGKNLSEIGTVIGTGGIFKYGKDTREILLGCTFRKESPLSLRPKNPRLLVDKAYLMFACGLLSTVAPEIAIRILRKQLKEI